MKEPRPQRFSVFDLLCGLSLLVALGFLVMWSRTRAGGSLRHWRRFLQVAPETAAAVSLE